MLLVIGDSHSVIWGGKLVLSDKDHGSLFPNIAIHYLGAPLAYNLIDDTDGAVSAGKWGIEVLNRVRDTAGVTAVCLCFGEIDVRMRAVKNALENGISLAASVQRIADRMVAFCDLSGENARMRSLLPRRFRHRTAKRGIRTFRPTGPRRSATRRRGCSRSISWPRAGNCDPSTSSRSSIDLWTAL